jgi:hypothetical protein
MRAFAQVCLQQWRFRFEFLLKSKYHFGDPILQVRLIEANREVGHLAKM